MGVQHYVVQVETDRAMLHGAELDRLLTDIIDFHPSVRESNQRNLIVTVTVPADDLRQAVTAGLALIGYIGAPVFLMAQPEYLRDESMDSESGAESRSIADEFGAIRRTVLNRMESGVLCVEQVDRERHIPADAVPPDAPGSPWKADGWSYIRGHMMTD